MSTLNEALELCARYDADKIGLSVTLPKVLKDDFELVCKENGVSMASMLKALITVAVNEHSRNFKNDDNQ